MRAFIAIDLPQAVHDALAEVQRRMRGVAPDVRWTRSEGIHLTLKFLGEISDAQVKAVVEKLAELSPVDPFPVEVKGFGFFPHAGKPRVFWAGVVAPPALAALAAKIETTMEKAGFAREDRGYSPHLTLARFQVPRPQTALEAAIGEITNSSLGAFEASEFFLFESKLSPRGSQYRKVMRFPR